MNKKIKVLDEMILVGSSGQSREECQSSLDDYLKSIHIPAKKYFFIEAFSGGVVVGAMAFALVDEEPKERNRDFSSSVVKESPYLIFDIPYEELESYASPEKMNAINDCIKDEGYRSNDFPFFEFLDEENIRIYMKLKER